MAFFAAAVRSTPARIEHLYRRSARSETARVFLHYGDLVDGMGLREVLSRVSPDEVYNLGAQSHVRVSFEQPVYTVQCDALGTINLLEAIRDMGQKAIGFTRPPAAKCSARRSRRRKPKKPRSIPAALTPARRFTAIGKPSIIAKRTGCLPVNGILFNHESPRRGETFVTRKITRAATRIKEGLQEKLYPGQSRRQTRLGLCRRLRRGDVADASAGPAG